MGTTYFNYISFVYRGNICSMSLTSDPPEWPACSPKEFSDEEEDDATWQWAPGRFM